MEVIKHPKKQKPFSRTNVMDFAKVIRNVGMAPTSRVNLVRELANYLATQDQFFDRKVFTDIALSKLDKDVRTETYSTLKDL